MALQKDSGRLLLENAAGITLTQVVKRLFDILICSLLIVCLSPLFIILSVLILFKSGRPVFFLQERVGKNDLPFTIFKFRSMNYSKHNPDRHAYDWKEGVPDHFTFKTAFDETVTPLGRVLRKYSLDELPQLFNVLFGDMSLVGPRPEIPEITTHYTTKQAQRLKVKPGITGYAQVNGRSEIDHGKKIELDLYYVENQSFRLDLRIIWLTMICVVIGKGSF